MNSTNAAEVFSFLIEAKKYILSLKVRSRQGLIIPMIESDYSTGFRGFIIDIISVMGMYEQYVENHHWLLFLATYRLSQDHLEMFFGNI